MARPRLPLLCAAALVAFVAGATGADAGPAGALEAPQLADVAVAYSTVRSSTLNAPAARRLSAAPSWGGSFTAGTGEAMTIYVSNAYPPDPAVAQRWADFFARLVHGAELSELTAYLAPLGEVQSVCGHGALACYSPAEELLVAPGESPSETLSAEAVATHEYGHHVAANRLNTPWPTIDYGTKRWASYLRVCARARGGELFPGDAGSRYRLNPGEGFAESYRVLNERRLGLPESEWMIVSQLFYPDETALALLEQDVTAPKVGATKTARTGVLAKASRPRTYTVSTPLDGSLGVALRVPRTARLALELVTGSGTRVARAVGAGRTVSLTTTVCGARVQRLRVSRIAGSGRFSLSVFTP